MSPLEKLFCHYYDVAAQDDDRPAAKRLNIIPVHRTRPRGGVFPNGRGYGVGTPILYDGDAANDPPRFLVFSAGRARRAGLLDIEPLARRVPYAELRQLAEGVVADEAGVQAQANELGGAYVRNPDGSLRWVEAARDHQLDQAVARDERRWADERLARPSDPTESAGAPC